MSALPPKADISERMCDVRFVPKADICGAAIDRAYWGHALLDVRQ
jgi:hypothetical protein